ncbi:MAG: hypothetical protein RLZZ428_433 [Pseudomonadota bacterium]
MILKQGENMFILFTPQYQTMWDALSSMMAVVATGMASYALIYSVKTYKKTMQIVHYGEIDKMYFEILKESMSKPYLSHGDHKRSKSEKAEYEIYAFIVWNFLESIYDRCEKDPILKETWYPILKVEGEKHKSWIALEENKVKFKEAFLDYIQNNISF